MQVLVLVVQNDAQPENIGVATSTATFFRSVGGAFGVAIFGAIFAARLSQELSHLPAAVVDRLGSGVQLSPAEADQLPPLMHAEFLDAFANALHGVFLWGVAIAIIPFVLSWFLKEVPLRTTLGTRRGRARRRGGRGREHAARGARAARGACARADVSPTRRCGESSSDQVRTNDSAPPSSTRSCDSMRKCPASQVISVRVSERPSQPSSARLHRGDVVAHDARRERVVLDDLEDRVGRERDLRARDLVAIRAAEIPVEAQLGTAAAEIARDRARADTRQRARSSDRRGAPRAGTARGRPARSRRRAAAARSSSRPRRRRA